MKPRSLFLGLAVAAVALTVLAAGLLLANPPRDCCLTVQSTQQGDGYFVAVEAFGFPGRHVSGHWSTHAGTPDRVLLLSGQDAVRVLAGGEPERVLGEWRPSTAHGELAFGEVAFRLPEFRCSGPNGGCNDGDLPTLVWLRGDDWKGTPWRALEGHTMEPQGDSGVGGSGPLLFRGRVGSAFVVAAVPLLCWAAVVAAGSAVVAAAVWGAQARRRRAPPAPPDAHATGTEQMLRLLHLSELYVATIARYFLVSAAVIVALAALAMYLALPPALEAAEAAMLDLPGEPLAVTSLALALAIPFATGVAFVFWAAQYRRVRAEVRRWRAISERMAASEARVLQP
jgi:hypothetical protein